MGNIPTIINTGDELFEAASSWHESFIIDKNVNVNTIKLFEPLGHVTALHVACFYGFDTLVKALLDRNADPNIIHESSPMNVLCQRNGSTKILQYLLNANTYAYVYCYGGTPLTFAISNKNVEHVELLLNHCVSANRLIDGISPLMLVNDKPIGILVLLLANGANVNEQTHTTPIHEACRNGNSKVLKILLEFGADHTMMIDDETAFDLAKRVGNYKCVKILRKHADRKKIRICGCKHTCGK